MFMNDPLPRIFSRIFCEFLISEMLMGYASNDGFDLFFSRLGLLLAGSMHRDRVIF